MKTKLLVISGLVLLSTISCGSRPDDTAKNSTEKSEVVSMEVKSVSNTSSEAEGQTVHLTKEMFLKQVMNYEKNPNQWVYQGDKPAIIDFYADWCKPCKITSPIMDELAKDYAGEVIVYKINTEKERELAQVFGIMSIPTFLFIPMEGKPYMSSGIAQTPEQTKAMFVEQIEKYLLAKEAM